MKKTSEINIRDPFVLPWDGKYYLYGTRGETCWGLADGTPYLVFCHEWLQVKDGEMCAMPLTPDLTAARTAACSKKVCPAKRRALFRRGVFWRMGAREGIKTARSERRILTWNPYKFVSLPRRTRRPCLRSTRRMWSVPPSALS